MRRTILLVAFAAGLAGCGDSPDERAADPASSAPAGTPTAQAPPTGTSGVDLCTLLAPADFESVAGLTVDDPAEFSAYDSPLDAYCVYGGDEDAPEVDIFVVSPESYAVEVYQTVLSEGPVAVEAEDVVPGTDQSAYGRIDSIDGVGVSLRRGGLVCAISVSNEVPDPQPKLVALAELLLGRADELGNG